MGDAVRRVQKHLQELSRDHLTSVEDRHHANLGWLQIELQQICKQIDVGVCVELTRPKRLSFSKPNALLPAARDIDNKPTQNAATKATTAGTCKANGPIKTAAASVAAAAVKPRTPVLPSPLQSAATRLVFDEADESPSRASKKRRLDDTKKAKEDETVAAKKKQSASAREVIDVDSESDVEVVAVVPATSKRMVKRMVKRTRTILKPKKIVKTEKKFVKDEKPVLPQVDVNALKVVDLKSELKKRGLKQTGVKAVLAVRLQEALEAEDAAQAEGGDDAGSWVTEEVVDEVMEEIEEEYEEEIEEEEEADDVSPSVDEESKTVAPAENAAVSSKESAIVLTQKETPVAVEEAAVEFAQQETERMFGEDLDASSVASTQDMLAPQQDALNRSPPTMQPAVPETKQSSKKSLSDMVTPMDEIVRESADGFISPEGKMPVLKVALARKSPQKQSEPAPATTNADTTAASTAKHSHPSAVPAEKDEAMKLPVPASVVEKQNPIERHADEAPQKSAQTDTMRGSHVRAGATASVTASEPTFLLAADQSSSTQLPSSTGKAFGTTRFSEAQKTPVSQEAMTPSRDLMERVRSLASSSRSSSNSSHSADKKFAGSMGFVEDSQPDQSPHHVSFATDFSTQSTRGVSTSQLELELSTSRAKTPDSGASVPPFSERVAQSEPRPHAAKPQVEDEADRKRREQQENIQREAQRLRLAMKQSAKKRFEESKTTNLFWKRDQVKTDVQSEVSAETESGLSASTPAVASSMAPDPSHPSKRGPANAERTTRDTASGVEKPAIADTVSSVNAEPAATTQSKSATMPVPSSRPVPKKESEKQSHQTRKRSSIVLDSSKSTLYPSKKRASLLRSKEVEPMAKRTSLTKTTSPARSLPKRSSVERLPTKNEAPKRKRSSEPRDKPADAAGAPKPKCVASSQPAQPSVRADTPSSNSQKASTLESKMGVSSAATAKRRDSSSSTISSSSNASVSESRSKPAISVWTGAPVRKPANIVTGIHSFTTLLEKDSQGSNTSGSSRQAVGVSALKLAEKSRLLEQKKNLEKAKRKEALAKRYEEQRKADEDKRKKFASMKEKAERDARLKREQDQATEKKQRDLELAKKRQQRLQELRSGMEKKKAQGVDKDQVTSSKSAAPVSRIAGSGTSATSMHSAKTVLQKHAQAKELTTYAMSDNEESSESEDEKDTERNAKNIPKWAQRENLERTLRIQFGPNAADPTPSIFPDFVDSCDLEAIFEPTDVRKKKRFQRRTSSGNWLGDRPTAREKAVYKKDMGFQR